MFKLTIKFDIDMLLLWLYNWSPFSTVAVLPITSHISVSVHRSAELQMIFGMTVKRVEFRKQYYKIVFNISSHLCVHQPWMFILKKVSVFIFSGSAVPSCALSWIYRKLTVCSSTSLSGHVKEPQNPWNRLYFLPVSLTGNISHLVLQCLVELPLQICRLL